MSSCRKRVSMTGLLWLSFLLAVNSLSVKVYAESGKEPAEVQLSTSVTPPSVPSKKVITHVEAQKICQRYEKKFVAVYSDVYWVAKCKRHLVSGTEIFEKRIQPEPVESVVLAAIPEGESYEKVMSKPFDCRQYSQQYFVYQMDYYWLDRCRLRRFPDESTWDEHRHKNHGLSKVVRSLTYKEFEALPRDKEFPSVLTLSQATSKPIEILPIEDACRSIMNSYVSYYDKIYWISPFAKKKGCYRKEIDSVLFTRQLAVKGHHIKAELTSDQAVSIPEYDPTVPAAPAKK